MKRILLVTTLLAGLSSPVYAGVNEGVAAATAGDYARAFAEFEPVANAGDPVAQYYLAKLYLEGRGPADGVTRGVDMMTRAANGGYPEAQAQLGLMYAMGMGVPVDNVKAHDLLTKALAALPDGVRRTVAEANRDTVLQRMTPAQRTALLAGRTLSTDQAPAVAATPSAVTTSTEVAAKPAATETKKPETTPVAATDPAPAKPAAKPETPVAKAEPAPAKPATTQTAAATTKPADAKPADKPATAASKPAETKPATTQVAATDKKPADTKPVDKPATPAVATNTKPADKPADAKPTATQTASATPAKPASEEQVKAGARIQIASLPTEDGAWAGWKEISAKYKDQLTGLTPVVEPADLGTKGTFYRVRVGPFETMTAASERCETMKQAGLDCLVVK